MHYAIHLGVKRAKTKIQIFTAGVAMLAFAAASVVSSGGGALAASDYTLFGDAAIVSGGNPGNAAQLRSSTAVAPGYGGVEVSPTSPIAWTNLTTLSTDYNVTDDDCGGGSPRITLAVDTNGDGTSDGNVHIALGPSPSFTDCLTGWQSSGNLIGNEDAGRYDFSQFGGSTFTTYSGAPAVVQAGSVVKVSVVVDGSWSAAATGGDGEQTVLVDNVMVNAMKVTFETADSCKQGGWKTMTTDFGKFKNQGDCVSYFKTNGRNLPSGQ